MWNWHGWRTDRLGKKKKGTRNRSLNLLSVSWPFFSPIPGFVNHANFHVRQQLGKGQNDQWTIRRKGWSGWYLHFIERVWWKLALEFQAESLQRESVFLWTKQNAVNYGNTKVNAKRLSDVSRRYTCVKNTVTWSTLGTSLAVGTHSIGLAAAWGLTERDIKMKNVHL